MAGIRLWEFYIRLPQDLVDDPEVFVSLNALRLLMYLSRHSIRLGKSVLRLTQDEVLHGRKVAGVRVDGGAKLAGPRHLILAREELIALGWLKFYNLEGAWVYELVIEEQPLEQFPKGTAAGSQKELLPVPKRNQNQFLKGTETGSQKELPIRDKEVQNKTEQDQNKSESPNPASPGGFRTTLEAIKISDARQSDLMQIQPALLAAQSDEDFNSIEVAHAVCVELSLAGNDNRLLLDDALKNYRVKNPARKWHECGEDLIDLWAEYKKCPTGKCQPSRRCEACKWKVGHKKFFEDGIYLKREEWPAAQQSKPESTMRSATDVLAERRARLNAKREN